MKTSADKFMLLNFAKKS